jgi:hypothetical protein
LTRWTESGLYSVFFFAWNVGVDTLKRAERFKDWTVGDQHDTVVLQDYAHLLSWPEAQLFTHNAWDDHLIFGGNGDRIYTNLQSIDKA